MLSEKLSRIISILSILFLCLEGCEIGDIGCSDRHAYQRLIRGPFKSALSKEEEGRIRGVPDHIKHAVCLTTYFFDLIHSF